MRILPLILAAAAALTPAIASAQGAIRVVDAQFQLTTGSGEHFTSADLVGAVFEMNDPQAGPITIRIDGLEPSKERPEILLHTLSVQDPRTGEWSSMCTPDASGRRAALPLAGRWENGRYVKDPDSYYITCTSGSQGKCVLWGYDPWKKSPNGEDLASYYQACQHMTRADYDGRGAPHTRDGTIIDMYDAAGIQVSDSKDDPAFAFEAGWGPNGAVCVAKTRWNDLLPLAVILESAPHLAAAPCDEAEARRRGAVLFNRSK